MKIGKYEIRTEQDKEGYSIDILADNKYITEKVYNNYTRNNNKYLDLIEFKNYTMVIHSEEYQKIITEVLKQFDTRDIKKELIDNFNDMLYNFNETLNDCYEIHNITELTGEQKEELNEIVKAAIKNYINKLEF